MEPLKEEVLEILSSLIAFKNRADANGWRDAFENMPVYMQRVGLDSELHKLHVVHVAGTKGKGSTCAMVESVLRAAGYRTGLFTSPHLVDVRERIRIDGRMVGKEVFERHFWACYDAFRAAATDDVGVPGYFRFITLLALKIFAEMQLDVVVLEVGIGGRLDATNIIPSPVACGITSLGFDHMEMLGDTLPKIAREKAGILRRGRPAFTVTQPDDAMEALQDVAARVGSPLEQVKPLGSYRTEGGECADTLPMALGGAHQQVNAGMALQLCAAFEAEAVAHGRGTPGAAERLSALRDGVLPAVYAQGLAATTWPGRSQVVHDPEFAVVADGATAVADGATAVADGATAVAGTAAGNGAVMNGNGSACGATACEAGSRLSFFIDGAHTPESMVTCADWFAQATAAQPPVPGATAGVARLLVFNCMKERDPRVLLPALASRLAARGVPMSHALFVPPESQYGFLPTKKNPRPPPDLKLTAPVGVGHAAAAAAVAAVAVASNGSGASSAPHTATTNGSTGSSTAPTLAPPTGPDYSWQSALQRAWEEAAAQPGSSANGTPNGTHPQPQLPPLPQTPGLPPQDTTRGAVAPSLRAALEWIRAVARARPQVQVQVLVTGSLYLVGDVLKLLNRAPK